MHPLRLPVKLGSVTLVFASAALLSACSGADPEEDLGQLQLRVSQPHAEEGNLAADVSVSDSEGNPVDLQATESEFRVEMRVDGGEWEPIEQVEADYQGPHRLDVMVVADNSGSQREDFELAREAVDDFSRRLLTRAALDRVGLVRVSTVASLRQGLTDDPDTLTAALDELFVANGWTALWDGVRLANEVLADTPLPIEPAGGTARFCADRTHRAIVAFTDGEENNSADEHETVYAGDGVDTRFEDLVTLSVGGIPTPVHWVGVGDHANASALEAMADATQARYVGVQHIGALHGALTSTAARLRSQVPICFELTACGHVELALTVEFELNGEPHALTDPEWLAADCRCTGKKVRCDIVE